MTRDGEAKSGSRRRARLGRRALQIARAGAVHLVEALEDTAQVFFRDADAGIADVDRQHAPRGDVALRALLVIEWTAPRRRLDHLGGDRDAAAWRRVFDAIVYQVDERLARPARVGQRIGKIIGNTRDELDAPFPC